MEVSPLAQLLHFAWQTHHLRPDVYMGLCSANDPVGPGSRAFMMASDRKAAEEGDLPVRLRNFSKKGAGQNGK